MVSILGFPSPSIALRRLEVDENRLHDTVYEINIPNGHSVVLSLDNNQYINSIWIDNPAGLGVITDRNLCSDSQDGGNCGFAQYIRLTRLPKTAQNEPLEELSGPSFSSGQGEESTLVTIITTNLRGGNRQAYQFLATATGSRSSEVSLISIIPHSNSNIVSIEAIKNGRIIAIHQGMADEDSEAWQSLEYFLSLINERYSVEEAIQVSSVPLELLNRLQQLNNDSRHHLDALRHHTLSSGQTPNLDQLINALDTNLGD